MFNNIASDPETRFSIRCERLMRDTRLSEITSWLRQKIAGDDAFRRIQEFGRGVLALTGKPSGWVEAYTRSITDATQPGDELWLFDSYSGPASSLHNERGIAFVRNQRAVAFFVEREYRRRG